VQARLGEALAQCEALITRAPADQTASNAAARITGDRCAHREPRREIADLISVSISADEGALGDQAWREFHGGCHESCADDAASHGLVASAIEPGARTRDDGDRPGGPYPGLERRDVSGVALEAEDGVSG